MFTQPREGRGISSGVATAGPLDEIVLKRLAQLGIAPALPCSDAVFVRRIYLDTIGLIPSADEARSFLEARDEDKRTKLIDHLLDRPEFADYWSMKWSDTLRVKSEFPINLWPLAAEGYHRWIRKSILDGWSYDRFAKALLLASGSNFRDPESNFYRAMPAKTPEGIAKAVALTLMGVRADRWPAKRLASLAEFFSAVGYKSTREWKEEIVFCDLQKAPARSTRATLPDGTTVQLSAGTDPREKFASWLISAQNPWFGTNAANRIWYWIMGRGIVHEPDDFRPDNPPSNPELLRYLASEFAGARFDPKDLYRLIFNSSTYQRSAVPASPDPRGADEFAHYRVRRLDAEVLIDAVNQITGTTESYSSKTPEPFTFIPESQRTVLLADGSITSPFLEMFGRPSRDTGLQSERTNAPSAAQRLHLLNSSHMQKKIEQGPAMKKLLNSGRDPSQLVENLYLSILSRPASIAEHEVASGHIREAQSPREAALDVAWALINSSEFLYRH